VTGAARLAQRPTAEASALHRHTNSGVNGSHPAAFEGRLLSNVFSPCGIRAVGLLATVAALAVARPVVAQESGTEPTPAQVRAAAEAFDLGRQAYKDGRYTEAAEQFERADANAPSSTALELAIRSRDKAGDLDRAGTLASLALALYPEDENITKIAPDVVARAGANMFELSVTCAEPCEITDGQQIVHGAASRQRTIFLAPGKHALRASFGDKAESKSIDAVAGGSGTLTYSAPGADAEPAVPPPATEPEPQPTEPAPEAPPEKKSSGWSPTVVWIGAGATAVAGGIAIWSGVDTMKNPGPDKVKAECPKNDTSCPLYKQGQAKETRTNVLLGVTGGLALATGLVAAFVVDWGPHSSSNADKGTSRGRVKPYFAWSNGPSLGARGSF